MGEAVCQKLFGGRTLFGVSEKNGGKSRLHDFFSPASLFPLKVRGFPDMHRTWMPQQQQRSLFSVRPASVRFLKMSVKTQWCIDGVGCCLYVLTFLCWLVSYFWTSIGVIYLKGLRYGVAKIIMSERLQNGIYEMWLWICLRVFVSLSSNKSN